jgi:hypothetical protein
LRVGMADDRPQLQTSHRALPPRRRLCPPPAS